MQHLQVTDLHHRARIAAAAGLGLVFAVVLLSAAIRLGQIATPRLDTGVLSVLRACHRIAASLEVVAAAWLGWFAWRTRAARPILARGIAVAVSITIALSVLGIVAGREPPPVAAAGNLLGGLSLLAVFAWALGVLRGRAARVATVVAGIGAALLTAQCLLGARISIFPAAASSPALPAHAMLGIVLAAGTAWLALRSERGRIRIAGFGFAILVPVAGFTALQYESSAVAAFAHAFATALFVVAAAYTRFRPT